MQSTFNKTYSLTEAKAVYSQPFNDLLFKAHSLHRQSFNPNEVQVSTLLSIKTGSCPEDCAYCPQSGHYQTDIEKEKLLPIESIMLAAKQAKEAGATRFCMGAAWRSPPAKAMPALKEAVTNIKAMGMETCLTAGMLDANQANELKDAGLDYYNHNLDTSEEYYKKIISTRTYQDRLDTLKAVQKADINVCCGGIIGMGESIDDRLDMLVTLANLSPQPGSVPINTLIPVEGTPLEKSPEVPPLELIRTIATARLLMPKASIRLSAGRKTMSEQTHAMCFFAGANSIHAGEKLLTTSLPTPEEDKQLFAKLGIVPQQSEHKHKACASV